MPSYSCRVATCTEYVKEKGGACPDHQSTPEVSRHSYYDQHHRNPEAKAFYDSAAWQRARAIKLRNNPVCERCTKVFATTVHHIIPLEDCSPNQRLDQNNLMSVCGPCHNLVEAEARRR